MLYLNIGSNKSIKERSVIGIFDMDSSTVSSITRKYLSEAEKRGEIDAFTDEIPKTFIVYDDKGRTRISFSQFSSSALYGRTEKRDKI